MLVNSKFLLDQAYREKRAVPAITVIDEHGLRGVIKACEEMRLPCMIAVGKSREIIETYAPLMIYFAQKAAIPVAVHLDHGSGLEMTKWAIDAGFTSVMFDGSTLPFGENVRKTKEVVDYAHTWGIPVEAELGHVGSGKDYKDELAYLKTLFTDPKEAVEFIESTRVDSLAVAIGTAHGEYTGEVQIDYERLAELRRVIKIPLVLHGGSGTGKEKLAKCVAGGINKVNLCTDLYMAENQFVIENAGKMPYPALCLGIQKAVYDVMMNYQSVFSGR